MEEARFWMLTKRKHSLTSHLQVSAYDNDSWEELAFAEDAAGALGGCIWPPRSYSCSFCRREFRSAQALGGHMNVHRRDRARLKQSPPLPQNDQNPNNSLFNVSDTPSPLDFQYPNSHNQICSSLCSPNPEFDPTIFSSSSLSTGFGVKNLFPSLSSPTRSKDREVSPRSSPSYYHIGPNRTSEEFNDSENIQSGLGEEEERILCKRRRINTSIGLSFFAKSNSNDRNHVRSEIFEVGNCSKEELDLELRLGDRPKVK